MTWLTEKIARVLGTAQGSGESTRLVSNVRIHIINDVRTFQIPASSDISGFVDEKSFPYVARSTGDVTRLTKLSHNFESPNYVQVIYKGTYR